MEVVRAINYLARDASWGTYKAELSNMRISEDGTSFELRYDGLCAGPQGRFAYRMKIRGDASGELTLQADGVALTDFPTNRTGFVVLHPSEAAGKRLTIRHSDGSIEETTFPKLISPDQPAFDISALTHEPAPGLVCAVAMEGDAFEMEDQRNWTDASFKTYVRPLSKPRPYVIGKGVKDIQRVTVSVRAETSAPGPAISSPATLTLGGPAGRMSSIALFVDPDQLPAAIAGAASLGPVPEIILRFDSARGHDQRVLEKAAELANALGGGLAVEAIFDAIHPGVEAQGLAAMVRLAGVEPSAILVSPRREFKTRPSNHLPNGERPIDEIVQALRAVGLACPIGAGTPSLFTEFNRNPPTDDADFVFFGNSAIVHAADEQSVMETLTVYPAVMETARQLCPGKPIWLGPCTIGLRHNPYGEAVAANPGNTRVPAAGTDPRQRALFGAAFAVGVAARAAETAAERLILAAPTGPFGLLNEEGSRRPLQAVHAQIAEAAGVERYRISSDWPGVAAIAFRRGNTIRVLAANLTPVPIDIALSSDAKLLCVAGEDTKPAKCPLTTHTLGPYNSVALQFVQTPSRPDGRLRKS